METLQKEFPGAVIIDVSSHAKDEFVKLSPFYPHCYIPVPDSDGWMGDSVEGIWQGLKVFEREGVDIKTMHNKSMKDIKRTTKVHGKILGHRRGVTGELMDYMTARKELYVPMYNWVLENKCMDLCKKIMSISETNKVVLLDYETNCNIEDITKPLSHASLIKSFVEKMQTDIVSDGGIYIRVFTIRKNTYAQINIAEIASCTSIEKLRELVRIHITDSEDADNSMNVDIDNIRFAMSLDPYSEVAYLSIEDFWTEYSENFPQWMDIVKKLGEKLASFKLAKTYWEIDLEEMVVRERKTDECERYNLAISILSGNYFKDKEEASGFLSQMADIMKTSHKERRDIKEEKPLYSISAMDGIHQWCYGHGSDPLWTTVSTWPMEFEWDDEDMDRLNYWRKIWNVFEKKEEAEDAMFKIFDLFESRGLNYEGLDKFDIPW